METKYSQAIAQRVEELQSLQKSQSKVVVYQRLQLLRLLKQCQAKTLTEASKLVGESKRSGLRWWKQYKQEGKGIRPKGSIKIGYERGLSLCCC